MTTIIREGRYLYTDSRYGVMFGGYRTHEDGPCKITRSKCGSCVIGMSGAYQPDIPFDILKDLIDEAVLVLREGRENKSLCIDRLRDFYTELEKKEDSHQYTILICSPLGSYIISTDQSNIPYEMYYHPGQHIAAGSGAIAYTPFRNVNIPIEEKFKIIYETDEHSGGNINRFDISSLTGAK